jgi:dolichol-phosphate mannosyltransferase
MILSTQNRVSLVVPCFNEEEAFPHLRAALTDLVRELEPRYAVEILLVDDGSRDRTWAHVRDFANENPRVRGVALSRNFGHQAALTCGYKFATGDAVVSLDADLQDPPHVVLDLIDAWEKGADVVYAVRRSRPGESRFKRWTAAAFYRTAAWLGAENLRADAGDFRLLSRRSLDALLSLPERHRFLRGMVGWVGFETADVYYDRLPRVAGHSKYPLRKMLHLANDAIVSCSTLPLRFPYYFSLTTAGAFAVYMIAGGPGPVPAGWSALTVVTLTFGCLTLCSLGILGEYVGRIYEQVKDRPLYLIRDTVGVEAEARGRRPASSKAA